MKNQYVGDIGDFGKYALLRAFTDAGVKVGVNWYLTENDGSTDGKFTEYLKTGDLRPYHPEIFDTLAGIAFSDSKTIHDVENAGILPHTLFYSEMLKPTGTPAERRSDREMWFQESMNILSGSQLIFMDPDNGLLKFGSGSKSGAEKYILPTEAEKYFRSGHNVVYYCHRGRRKESAWLEYISAMFERNLDAEAIVLTYHKGSQRSYVFMIHPEEYHRYRLIVDRFLSQWRDLFSEEYVNKDLCDTCKKVPAKIQINGEGGYCFDCYNKAYLKKMGLSDTFDYPKQMSVMEPNGVTHSFNIEHVILGDIVSWDAYEIDGNYHFREISDLYENGSDVAQRFFRKIVKGVCTKTLETHLGWASNLANKDGVTYSVKDKGVINIIEDEERDFNLGFMVDGVKFTPDEFVRLFGGYVGFDIHYEIRDASD